MRIGIKNRIYTYLSGATILIILLGSFIPLTLGIEPEDKPTWNWTR